MPTSEKKVKRADEASTSAEANSTVASKDLATPTAAATGSEIKAETASPVLATAPADAPAGADIPAAASDVLQEAAPPAILKTEATEDALEPWPESFTARLSTYLSEEKIAAVKKMFLEGHEPPFVSDAGWGNRPAKSEEGAGEAKAEAPAEPEEPAIEDARAGRGGRGGRGRGRGRGRGGRGGRGGGGDRPGKREDTRKVLSDVRTSRAPLQWHALNVTA